jgi:hypothetical protein
MHLHLVPGVYTLLVRMYTPMHTQVSHWMRCQLRPPRETSPSAVRGLGSKASARTVRQPCHAITKPLIKPLSLFRDLLWSFSKCFYLLLTTTTPTTTVITATMTTAYFTMTTIVGLVLCWCRLRDEALAIKEFHVCLHAYWSLLEFELSHPSFGCPFSMPGHAKHLYWLFTSH